MLVLERVTPGTTAAQLPDDEATRLIARTLLDLWVVPLADAAVDLPSVERECAALHDPVAVTPLPTRLVEAARSTLRELLASSDECFVLHGDLHHDNLLWSDERRAWIAIDPHGVVGDRGYDVGPLLINPWRMHDPWRRDPVEKLAHRRDVLHEVLGFDRKRLAAWGFVRAVLAEAWNVHDIGHIDGGPLRVAEALLTKYA